MKLNEDFKIEDQRRRIFSTKPFLALVAPCKINEGISRFLPEEMAEFSTVFTSAKKSTCFFIPASGSGSRMFDFLYEYLENPNDENFKKALFLFNNIASFAFFDELSLEIKEKIKNLDISIKDFIHYILEETGKNYGGLPKALFPFHRLDDKNLNPFQEHILQGKLISEEISYHFTIQKKFENLLKSFIEEIETKSKSSVSINFSEQNPNTDSYVFSSSGDLVFDSSNKPLMRPGGHGSLLENLQTLSSDLIFVKNIDNVQHFTKCKNSNEVWSFLAGLSIEIKSEIHKLTSNPSKDDLSLFNSRFNLYTESEINASSSVESILLLLKRPLRICGMVRNEGQNGGGPFFVSKNGIIQKQIIEKGQVDLAGDHAAIFFESTHFNPVMMVLDIKNEQGEIYDLFAFNDDEQFLKVEKNHAGKDVIFIELPGLWNGGMANWNTLFVEIGNEVFSPVKTVLDLINPSHLSMD
jgi:hypothetical protein